MDVPSDTDLFTARSELDRLESYRRWTYIAVLLLAVTIIMVSWLFREPADPFVTLTYPVVALALGILCVLFYIARLPVRQLEIASVAAVAALVMGRLSWHFYYGDPLNANLLVLVGGHYWAVAILMVGSFIALGYKGGVIVGAATFIPDCWRLWRCWTATAITLRAAATGCICSVSICFLRYCWL